MGSNVLPSSSKRSSLKKGTPCKQDKPEDLQDTQESEMIVDSDCEEESVHETSSRSEGLDEDDASVVSEGESEDDKSDMDDDEQTNITSDSSDNDESEDESRTMEEGDGVDFSDCDDDEFERDEEDMDVEGGDRSDIRVAANPAWAQAMAKILRTKKPSGKKAIVLSKAKTIQAAEAAVKTQDEEQDFEVVGEKEGKSLVKTEDVKPSAEELLQAKRERLAQCRVKQDEFDYNRERALSKIATKGVVQLFNAVRAQQKNLGSKLAEAHSTRMEDKLLKSIDKNSFLEHLTGKIRSRPVEESASPVKKEEVEIVLPKSWNELSKKVESNSWDKEIEIKDEPID